MNAPRSQQQDFDVGTLYAGRYLKTDDLGGKTFAATITKVEIVAMPDQEGRVRSRAALTLQGWPAQLLLNKTNFETIAAAYGRQSAGWIGKQIEVYPDTTLFGGRSVPCIRVRAPRPAALIAAIPGSAVLPSTPVVAAAATAAPPSPSTMAGDNFPY